MLLSESVCSLLTERVLQELLTIGIKTVEDFLSASDADICSAIVSLSDEEVHTLTKVLVLLFGALPPSSVELEDMKTSLFTFSTGSQRLDLLLEGVKTGKVHEIRGYFAETREFSLDILSTAVLSTTNDYVIYVDSFGAFSPRQFKTMLMAKIPVDKDQDLNSLLRRVILIIVTDIFELLSKLSLIQAKLSSETLCDGSFKFVLIDSLPDLLLPLSACDKEVLKITQDVKSVLKLLASEFSIAVLYTSTPYPFSRSKGHLIELKEEWKKLPDITLNISEKQM